MENRELNIKQDILLIFFGIILMTIGVISFLNCIEEIKNKSISKIPQTFEEQISKEISKVDLRGINPDYLLSMAILETGRGRGFIYKNSLNLFNIKADSNYPGQTFSALCRYRAYSSLSLSISDLVDILSTRLIYRKAYKYALMDDRIKFFNALQEAGYSEDKDYAKKLERIFRAYKLKEVKQRTSQYEIVGCGISHEVTCSAFSK